MSVVYRVRQFVRAAAAWLQPPVLERGQASGIQPGELADDQVSQLLGTVQLVQRNLNRNLRLEGVLLTMFDRRLRLSNQVAQEAIDYFGDLVYETMIPRNVRLSEAPSFGKPIILYDVECQGAQSYLSLAQEVIAANALAVRKEGA